MHLIEKLKSEISQKASKIILLLFILSVFWFFEEISEELLNDIFKKVIYWISNFRTSHPIWSFILYLLIIVHIFNKLFLRFINSNLKCPECEKNSVIKIHKYIGKLGHIIEWYACSLPLGCTSVYRKIKNKDGSIDTEKWLNSSDLESNEKEIFKKMIFKKHQNYYTLIITAISFILLIILYTRY